MLEDEKMAGKEEDVPLPSDAKPFSEGRLDAATVIVRPSSARVTVFS